MGLDLKVSPAVLIPRPETEELVEWILSNHPTTSLKLWDLCSGSGCIALGLKAQREQWDIKGFELSEAAIEIARTNAANHHLSVSFVQQDILQWQETVEQVELMVSNPPYVLPSEKNQMHKNVLEFEPAMALFVPEKDSLLFYREILLIARKQLHPQGKLYFEINPLLVQEMISLGKKHGFSSATVKKISLGKTALYNLVNMTIEERIEQLRNQLHQYNHAYYNEDRSEVSDFEFDQLLKELQSLEKAHPEHQDLALPPKGLEEV